jgi:hypothetical protein
LIEDWGNDDETNFWFSGLCGNNPRGGIKSEIDFPDSPAEVSSIVGEYGSGPEKYIRIEGP